MSADAPCKEASSRWEGTRTLAMVIAAGVGLVTAVAGGVGFVAGHFASDSELSKVKSVQNRLVACVERYAIPLYENQIRQLNRYILYVNAKSNVIAAETDPGGNYNPAFWWLSEIDNQDRSKDFSAMRSETDGYFNAVWERQKAVDDLEETFDKPCDKLKLERGQWDVSY